MMIDFWFFAIIFGVLFLLGKAVWQDSKSFKLWKWKKILALKNWKERTEYSRNYKIKQLWKKLPTLNKAYIAVALAVFIPLILLFVIFYFQIIFFLFGKESGEIRDLAFAFFGTISGLAGLFGVYLAILRSNTTERQTQTAEQGLITDRINKATEGLGKNNEKGKPVVEVRLGALYALERIAQDSFRDHVQIMEILCAYVRHNSPLKSKNAKPKKLREDIQAALTIIGRRDVWNDAIKRLDNEHLEGFYIDLSNCDLYGAQLNKVEMSWANFKGTNLEGAHLMDANLNHARFENTNLVNALLSRVKLENATFHSTNMSGAFLGGSNMKNAAMYDTNLSQASISGVNITTEWTAHVNMRNAITSYAYAYKGDFSTYKNFTQKQLNRMFCGKDVKIPSNLKRPKHWPTDDLLYDRFTNARMEWQKTLA